MATIATRRNYEESERVRQARAALDAQNAAKPGAYQSGYKQQLDDLYKQITERKPFQYDVNADPLYQQYKDQYVRQGKQAMQHTIGQAAALTGGYGNSYAQSAGQQAYNAYLEQLGAVVPELYGQAAEQYAREGEEMRANYGLLSDREAQDYARYADEFNRYLNERDYLAGQAREEADEDFRRWQDAANREYQEARDTEADRQWNEEYQRQLARDAESTRQWNESFNYQKESDAAERERQAARDAEADRQWNETFNYQKESDAAERAYRQQQFEYQQTRDQNADEQWRKEYERQAARDAESDRQWNAAFAYQQSRDTMGDEQWEKQFNENVRQFNAQMAARSSGGSGGGSYRGGSGGGSGSGSGGASSGKSPTTQEYNNMQAAARKGEANLDAYLDVMQEKYGLSYDELLRIKSQYTKYFPETKQDVYNGQKGATGYYV